MSHCGRVSCEKRALLLFYIRKPHHYIPGINSHAVIAIQCTHCWPKNNIRRQFVNKLFAARRPNFFQEDKHSFRLSSNFSSSSSTLFKLFRLRHSHLTVSLQSDYPKILTIGKFAQSRHHHNKPLAASMAKKNAAAAANKSDSSANESSKGKRGRPPGSKNIRQPAAIKKTPQPRCSSSKRPPAKKSKPKTIAKKKKSTLQSQREESPSSQAYAQIMAKERRRQEEFEANLGEVRQQIRPQVEAFLSERADLAQVCRNARAKSDSLTTNMVGRPFQPEMISAVANRIAFRRFGSATEPLQIKFSSRPSLPKTYQWLERISWDDWQRILAGTFILTDGNVLVLRLHALMCERRQAFYDDCGLFSQARDDLPLRHDVVADECRRLEESVDDGLQQQQRHCLSMASVCDAGASAWQGDIDDWQLAMTFRNWHADYDEPEPDPEPEEDANVEDVDEEMLAVEMPSELPELVKARERLAQRAVVDKDAAGRPAERAAKNLVRHARPGPSGSTPPRKRARSRAPRPEDAHPILAEASDFLARTVLPRRSELDVNDPFSVMAYGDIDVEVPFDDASDDESDESEDDDSNVFEGDESSDADDDSKFHPFGERKIAIHTSEPIDAKSSEETINERIRKDEAAAAAAAAEHAASPAITAASTTYSPTISNASHSPVLACDRISTPETGDSPTISNRITRSKQAGEFKDVLGDLALSDDDDEEATTHP